MSKDFIFIGILLVCSGIFSYFKGYIDTGIAFIMTTTGGYILATGLFFAYEKDAESVRKKGLPNKIPKA